MTDRGNAVFQKLASGGPWRQAGRPKVGKKVTFPQAQPMGGAYSQGEGHTSVPICHSEIYFGFTCCFDLLR